MTTTAIQSNEKEIPDGRGRLLLSVKEAGELLHLSRPVVYDLIHSGKLRSLRLGPPPAGRDDRRVHRIPRWALDEFIEAELSGDPNHAA